MSRLALTLLCLLGVLGSAGAGPASGHWTAAATGSGTVATLDMPTGATPSGTASGRTVTVAFAQNAFDGSTLGARGGNYTLLRYAEGSTTAVAPSGACGATFSGAAASFSCVETNVPYGSWEYRVTPRLLSFTGTEGLRSAVVAVELPAPVLDPPDVRNPASGAPDGPIVLAWSTVAEATGYDVFRRTSGGAYGTTPLNGGTPLTATTFTDATAGGGATYDYVVRAVAGPPRVVSRDSNARTAKVVTRPAAPAGAVTATAGSGGAVNVSWSAVPAADGYNVYRRLGTGAFDDATPLNGSTPVTSSTFVDDTAAAGATYRYAVRALVVGAGGTQVVSSRSAESGAASCSSSYLARITGAGPTSLFRLGEATGTVAVNTSSATRNGVYGGTVTRGVAGAIACDANTAATFDGSTGYVGAANGTNSVPGPTAFTVEAWFKTTVGGGRIVGFGNARTGNSANTDRHVYMTDAGNLVFGVFPGVHRTITSPLTYTDGEWHMVTASLGAAGMRLYVDGVEVAANAMVTTARNGNGYWRMAHDNLTGWPQSPTRSFFTGSLDEVAIFGSQLPATTIAAHHGGNLAGGSCSTYSTTTAAATADTWLNQGSPTSGNPTDSVLKVTSKNGNSNTRALVQTPLPGAVPAGCALISARLRLWNKSPIAGRTLTAQPNAAAWNAATAWAAQPAVAGTASTAATPATEGYMEWDVLTQVKGMLTAGNYGFSIRDQTENSAAGVEQQFESVEGSAGRRPELIYEIG